MFANIKKAGKFRRFRFKGNTRVGIEFGLKAIAHNIKKLVAQMAERHFAAEKSQKTMIFGDAYLLLVVRDLLA